MTDSQLGILCFLLTALQAWSMLQPIKQLSLQQVGKEAAQQTHSLLSHGTRAYLDSARERWGVKGVSVSLVTEHAQSWTLKESERQGWVSETLSFGAANAAGDLVDENSLFAIASNSKLFTALSVGLLIEKGTVLSDGRILDWSTKIKDIIPDWQLGDEYASEHVDIIDLLNMRSGMPHHDLSYGPEAPSVIIANMRHLPASREIRQDWQYNNMHYITLSHLIPTLTNVSYIDFVQNHILNPLGMTSSTYNATIARLSSNLTDGFFHTGINDTRCLEEWHGVRHMHPSCKGETRPIGWWTETDGVFRAGPGGLITSGRDMTRWLQELLDPKVLPSSLITKYASPLTVMPPEPRWTELGSSAYGLAQWTYTYRGERVVAHTGSLPGQTSLLHDVFAYRMVDELLGLDPIDWEERYFHERVFDAQQYATLPDQPTQPEGGFTTVSGTYRHAGYGEFSLSPLRADSNLTPSLIATLSNSRQPRNLAAPIFIAPIGKVFASHLVFTHFDGGLFNWSAVAVRGELSDPVVKIEAFGSATVTVEGIGMFGSWWGQGPGVDIHHAVEKDAKELSEVWYHRLA